MLISILSISVSLLVGFGISLIIYRPKLEVARTRLLDSQKSLERQREEFDKTLGDLKTTFKGLSADVLKESREEFLKQAEPKIGEHIRPLKEALKRYEEAIHAIEGKRDEAYGGLKKQVELLQGFAEELRDETGSLKAALKSPTVRGRWGELTLKRVVELAGMSEYCDFNEQVSAEGEDGRMRPDMVVKIPGGRTVIVDAKTPLDAYLLAMEAKTEKDRNEHLVEHARAVRDNMRRLSQKTYREQFDSSTDLVVMFLPGESFAAAALGVDRTLFEDGMKNHRVILATPATLIALLRSFAFGWQQEKLAENALRISDAGKDLFDRINSFVGHFGKIGKNLRQATDSFNDAVGSFERMLLPGAKKLRDLGATRKPDAELPELSQVEVIPRQIGGSYSDVP